jgi:hypothetical protein
MPKNKKKSKQQGMKAAPAQTDDDFNNMLAEVCAADPNTSSSSCSSTSAPPVTWRRVSDEALVAACGRRDLVQLRRWGRQGIRIVSGAPLCVCAFRGARLDILRCLVNDLGADVNQRGNEGGSPLFFAAQQGHLNILLCLLEEFGADVDNGDDSLRSPLFVAARQGHLNMVRCLLKFRTDINKASNIGETPLMAASLNKHAKVVTWLIRAGADPQTLAEFPAGTPPMTAADFSRGIGASAEQTAYLEAKTHCSNTGCSGAGAMKCTRCRQARYCGEQSVPLAHWKAHKADCKRMSTELKEGGQ